MYERNIEKRKKRHQIAVAAAATAAFSPTCLYVSDSGQRKKKNHIWANQYTRWSNIHETIPKAYLCTRTGYGHTHTDARSHGRNRQTANKNNGDRWIALLQRWIHSPHIIISVQRTHSEVHIEQLYTRHTTKEGTHATHTHTRTTSAGSSVNGIQHSWNFNLCVCVCVPPNTFVHTDIFPMYIYVLATVDVCACVVIIIASFRLSLSSIVVCTELTKTWHTNSYSESVVVWCAIEKVSSPFWSFGRVT